jgi:DNA-directed RNA polymerase subunit omega
MLPSPDILNEFPYGKFVLSNLAAKRAKQLREGAPALVQVDSNHPLTIALAEIAAGKIKPIMPAITPPKLHLDQAPILFVDDTMPAELGMLLPALDETEVALVLAVEDDHDHDHDGESDDIISLSDLVDDEEDTQAVPSDDDTLSLSDIADAETAGDEESEEV